MSEAGGDLQRYEVDPAAIVTHEKVGSGCTADVFRGEFGGRVVAIKQLNFDKATMGLKEQMAFDRELAIMPKCSHPNLVEFIAVASTQRPFRILTEFCVGGCLFELLHNCDHIDLVWGQQLKMCQDVALAMNYLHNFNPQIIHRDLKSLNLLLSQPVNDDGDVPMVKVSDFGLSRMKDTGGAEWSKMTAAAGTCHWMAPEVFQGTKYDEKVDVYSYAMILFEVLCREVPFEDVEAAHVGRRAVAGERPDLEAVPPGCPPVLRALMISCWHHDPTQRPPFPRILEILATVQA